MKALVTGGGGFVGRAVAEALLARGDEVRIVSRSRYPEVEALGAEGVQLDLASDIEGLEKALEGIDVVFHVAAKTGVWGKKEEFESANITATENILAAVKKAGIKRLVFTSSPSVTFDGKDAEGLTEEQTGYPDHFEAPYPETKAKAEQIALAANSSELSVCALRPHLVWGPRDPHLLPRVAMRRKQGRLRQVGEGKNRVALTYIDHAADAHLKAADSLAPDAPHAGKAYFITDGEPIELWPFIEKYLKAMELSPIPGAVSAKTAYRVGGWLENVWRWFGLGGEPPMTRFVAKELATSHWYDISAAERDFGYKPFVDHEEAFQKTVEALKIRLN